MTDTVEQAQSEVAAAEAQLAAAEATAQAAVQLPAAQPAQPERDSPEAVAQRRLADGTARPDGREPSTIPERVLSA